MSLNGFVVSGERHSELAALDDAILRCMTEHNVPGAALALAKDGQLLYARGFGWADLQALEPVQPHSLFRIASVSKPITAVAIFQLVEAGRLSLEERVFELLHVEPYLQPGAEPDPRLAQITVRHLLQHTGGWDRARSGDPMFFPVEIAQALDVPAPAAPAHIMRWVTGRSLDFDPGQEYAYSNFGYCLLGRIIEKLTGLSYEEAVHRAILAPLGISTMQIGRTHLAGRLPGEVVYYPLTELSRSVFQANLGYRVPTCYGGWYLEAMDAHGGWVACAPDLVKFGSAFPPTGSGPLLSQDSVVEMFAPPLPPVACDENGQTNGTYYACGWQVDAAVDGRPAQQHHNGMLFGTAAVLRRRDDGLCWAALFNAALGRKKAYIGDAIVQPVDEVLTQLQPTLA